MIDRRLFMKIAAAGLCSLALMERKLLADDCVPPTEDLVDYFISQSTIPDCLSDQIFLGFHAVKFHAKARRLPLDFLFMNYGLLAGTRVDGIRSRLKLVKRKICGREDFDYEIVAGPLDGLYSAKSEQTLINNQQTIKRMASLPYGDRVNEIIKILVVSFRDVLFKEQQSEVLPKTFPVLRVDNTGICRDFALTRYSLAKGLGVKEEHLFIVSYLNINPQSDGHANLAVYNPDRQLWTIIEGTGRSKDQVLGSTCAYENEGKSWEKVSKSSGDLVPVTGISSKGIFLFDSIVYDDPSPAAVFKPRLPLPMIEGEARVLGTPVVLPEQAKANTHSALQSTLHC